MRKELQKPAPLQAWPLPAWRVAVLSCHPLSILSTRSPRRRECRGWAAPGEQGACLSTPYSSGQELPRGPRGLQRCLRAVVLAPGGMPCREALMVYVVSPDLLP